MPLQTVILWAPSLEMVLTGCSENGSLLGWDLHPLKQSAKLWLHTAGITHVHELVGMQSATAAAVFMYSTDVFRAKVQALSAQRRRTSGTYTSRAGE